MRKALFFLLLLVGCLLTSIFGQTPNTFTEILDNYHRYNFDQKQLGKINSGQKSYVFQKAEKPDNNKFNLQVQAKAFQQLGDLFMTRQQYVKSLFHYLESLRRYQLVENQSCIDSVYKGIAGIFRKMDTKAAEKYFQLALNSISGLETETEFLMVKYYVANIYFNQGDYLTCLMYLEELFPKSGSLEKDLLASKFFLQGKCKKNTGKLIEAHDAFYRSLEIFRILDKPEWILLNHIQISEVYSMLADTTRALYHLDHAEDIAINQNEKYHLNHIYYHKSALLEAQGYMTQALDYLMNYYVINDSVFKTEKDQQLEEIYKLHETERIDLEIAALSKEKRYQNELIRFHWILIVGFVSGIAFITGFVIIIFNQKEKQKQTNLDLVRKNLQIVENEKNDIQNIEKLEEEIKEITSKYKSVKDNIFHNLSALNLDLSLLKKEEKTDSDQFSYQTIEESGRSILSYLSELENPERKLLSANLPKEDSQNKNFNDDLLASVLTVMERTRLFLEEGFTLEKLASLVNSNKRDVSVLINEEFGQGFNNFINNYRIKEARKMLVDARYQNYTIEGVANTVGFKSKSSFNLYFKKFTGLTPSYFKNTVMLAAYMSEDSKKK